MFSQYISIYSNLQKHKTKLQNGFNHFLMAQQHTYYRVEYFSILNFLKIFNEWFLL